MVQVLRGDLLAREIEEELRGIVATMDTSPALAVVLVGDDPASHIYVSRKRKAAARVGIVSIEHRLPATTDEARLLALIGALNDDPGVHGILVQLPLPAGMAADRVLDAIAPGKDVDGFHPVNVGRLSTGKQGGLVPCTPLGCMLLLEQVVEDFRGLKAVVIGKSNIVGKPAALLLLERECTVTVTHIHTRGLPEICRGADIIIAAAGVAHLVRGNWVKTGAIIIDVGINRTPGPDGRAMIVGDVAADECDHAAVITPVPGGVGPMTIACLLRNTLDAARRLTPAGFPADRAPE
ncbi:methylenetetrahydrofolate dehydrogenase (NADP+)/methenyltetrahydrofolate cyclohydrolase [Novosphingobium sp. SG751A]|uniref:bifunctional 5,10-methylenetetrahydrofolate dehydrogenase/5,10-methenyltetrahydrofolate cyclohydrolase n=1 Tax=Novosphingobium sp. SG751A TaxID=2587000 RepID=UPI001554924E|nr:tetrahydrofolate dehydrogenase/cyclohydrolase catalytic domain-containing protein [Novosphingobium sp. SG751A]NOW47830.1 methylenetetrahydrofolate dehydrogenase (NADP+)/methenyltetrahydrofolate cyclohydrolase [Novosphingobium sp. SG751A]